MKRVFLFLILVVVFAQCAVATPAPDFTLPDIYGKNHSLHDYKGKLVVLEWFNPGCPYVKKHYFSKNMQRFQAKYTEKGVVWLTINSGAPGRQGHMRNEEAQKFSSDFSVAASAQLVDESGEVGKAYDAKATPHMFVIDKNSEIVYQGAIDDNDSANPSSIEGAKNYVATALDDLLAGKKVSVESTEPYGCSVKYAK